MSAAAATPDPRSVLDGRLPGAVLDGGQTNGDAWLLVDRSHWLRACQIAKQDLGLNQLCFVSAVDHQPGAPRFELICQLRGYQDRQLLRLRCWLDETEPKVDSLTSVWGNANWDEREAWEMFGIVFAGHPDLRHLLLPADWIGFPLRRDFPVGGEVVDFSEDRGLWKSPPPGQ